MKKTLSSIALAAGCGIALTAPAARAHTLNSPPRMNSTRQNAGERPNWLAEPNHAANDRYDLVPKSSATYREWRIRKECGHITVAHLRTGCIDTVNIEEDQRALSLGGQRTRTLNEGL